MFGFGCCKSPRNPTLDHRQLHEFSDESQCTTEHLQNTVRHGVMILTKKSTTLEKTKNNKNAFDIMPRRRRKAKRSASTIVLLAMAPRLAVAQSCISLAGSTTCPAFNASSIVPSDYLVGIFSFLSNVTDLQSFDTQLQNYVASAYVRRKYVTEFGCSNVDTSNTTDLYARYTRSFICNAIIQNSISTCALSTAQSRPLCADSCAEFALSEQTIISSPDLCGTTGNMALTQLRADFTNCALPANSIAGTCVAGYLNEPDNCGFQSNLDGLCTYCSSSTVNATDSCCYNSNVAARCQGVRLPSYVSTMLPLFTTATTSSISGSSTSIDVPFAGAGGVTTGSPGLTGGKIAGIVVGSLIGFGLLLGLLICCCMFMRRKKKQQQISALNQPSPPRTGPSMAQTSPTTGFQALPGSRVTRMSALEGPTPFPPRDKAIPSTSLSSPESLVGSVGAVGAATLPKRNKSRQGVQVPYDGSSPESGGYSSPELPESEQMDSFKDYYSADEIHPGDLVSTLWAYSPRAPDEFELERGDMVKIVGIWDDGWATGIKVESKADEWEARRDPQRDSGVSSNNVSPPPSGRNVKAFPLVCVCLPQHWRKTIEGDSTDPPSTDSPYLT